MNFGEVIKSELMSRPLKDLHCKKAFLAGLIRGSGAIVNNNDDICLEFKVNDFNTATIVFAYLKAVFGIEVNGVSLIQDKLNKKNKYDFSLNGSDSLKVLFELGIITENDDGYEVSFDFYNDITKKDCCLHSFLKGLVVSSCSCTVPDNIESNTKYHLEMVFSHTEPAQKTAGILFKNGISSKIMRRKDKVVLYIKSGEDIKDFLAFLPAPVSVLKLTDIIIEREIINNTNRAKNCDIGNVNRQVEASAKQIKAIEKIIKYIGIESLKPDLRVTAIARKDYPYETLTELSERLKVTKSCLNNRLRKIVSISNEIQE